MPIFNFFNRPNVLELKSEENVDGLIDALNYKKDHNLRISAAWALGEIGDSDAVEPLIDALDDRKRVREVVAKALGEIGDPEAVDALVEQLEDKNWEVRSTVAKSLGKIGDDRAVEALTDALKDKNEIVRWYASQALEAITGEAPEEEISSWKQ
jgi:HEAT repeat protein